MNNGSVNKIVKKQRNNRPLLIFVCIFLTVVLVFCAIMLTVTLVKRGSYAARYEGNGMDVKTASYFVSYYKYQYIGALTASGVNAYDTPAFWNKKPEGDDKCYGEHLKEGAARYLKEILAANALFDRYESLDSVDRKRIDSGISEKLNNAHEKMDGTVETFNTFTAPLGFDYKAFSRAAEMLYKATRACSVVFGENGEVIQASTADCEEYLSTYSHIRLMFVDSEQRRNEDGEAVGMTDAEKNSMNAELDELRELIKNGTAGIEAFEYYFDKYNFISALTPNGEYYIREGSAFTEGDNSIRETFPNVVDTALDLKLDGVNEAFAEAEYEDGVCFIYKYAPESGAYADADFEIFFGDFFKNASRYFYAQAIELYSAGAELTEKFYEIDIISLPYRYEYFI